MKLPQLILLCLMGGAVSAFGALPPLGVVDRMAEDYFARRLMPPFPQRLTMEEGIQVQRDFIKLLQPKLGKPVGYKVGLVSREAQRRWSIEQPVRGVLLEKMLLPDNSEISPNFGVAPLLEADLIVTVKDAGINKAGTHVEVLRHLKDIVAFIELPDAYISTNAPTDGAALAAVNVGARFGILGSRVPVKASQKFADALAAMTVVMTDEAGLEMGRGQGKIILDHPLNAVLWLIEDLNLAGEVLRPGDMLSLGSIRMMPFPPAKSVTITYSDLPGGPMKVTLRIKPQEQPAR